MFLTGAQDYGQICLSVGGADRCATTRFAVLNERVGGWAVIGREGK